MSAIQLNEQQQAAVEHGEGPLLIVAGAGTGKTRVIVERVGDLLSRRDGLKPENILALAFGNKAAAEMRQRAVARFGPRANGCRFSTFHSFCYDLLSQHAPRRALDKVDQWIFLRRHLEELELDHYFRVAEPGRFLEDLVDFCSRCHDNLVSPDDYTAYVEKMAADCQAAARSGQSPPECAEEEIARQREVARVYTRLEQLQEQDGLISYGGMISQAVGLLDASPELLRRLQQQYHFLLVDEFQDTNTAQFELLVRLAGDRKNLTVVGDDDQAIYRFRGASYASFQQFAERFPEHVRIVLSRNYRSTPHILSVASAAIAFNSQDRYQPDKKLVAEKPAGPKVEVWEFPDDDAKAEYTAQAMARWLQEGRARSFSDFAVLYRSHHHRNQLVAALRRRRIPFAIRNLAINSLPVARDLVAYLRVIGDPRDSVSLVRVLSDPRWQTQPELLIQYCRLANEPRGNEQRNIERRIGLAEWIEKDGLPFEWKGREPFLQFRNRFRSLSEEQPLSAWFPLLRQELALPRRSEEKPAVAAFSEFLAAWEREKSATGLLQEFLEYLAYFEEAGGIIPLPEEEEKPPSEPPFDGLRAPSGTEGRPSGSGQPPSEPRQENLWEDESAAASPGKVQLMTVHGAKGLEFEHVFVWQLVKKAFPTIQRRPLIALPAALWKGPLPRGDFHVEEERRLFYVALTRARSTLILATVSNERKRPSLFLEQLQEIPPPVLERKRPILPAAREANPAPDQPSSRMSEWAATPIAPAAKGFALSVSQLETYLKCPLQYYFNHVWKIPVAPSAALLFGAILHSAVKEVVYAVAREPARLSQESLEAILGRHWSDTRFPDPVQERKYRQMGLEQLAGVRQAWSAKPFELLFQEKQFELRSGGARVVGRIDQIHRTAAGEVELIEYKTGRPQTRKEAERSRQLTLYAQACREALGLEPAALVLYNLATQEAVRTQRGEEDFRALEQTIRETNRQILAGSFPAQPGFHCRYCPFRPLCPAHEEPTGITADDSPVSTGGLVIK